MERTLAAGVDVTPLDTHVVPADWVPLRNAISLATREIYKRPLRRAAPKIVFALVGRHNYIIDDGF